MEIYVSNTPNMICSLTSYLELHIAIWFHYFSAKNDQVKSLLFYNVQT